MFFFIVSFFACLFLFLFGFFLPELGVYKSYMEVLVVFGPELDICLTILQWGGARDYDGCADD